MTDDIERLVASGIIRDGLLHQGTRGHYEIRSRLGDSNPQARNLNDEEGFVTSKGRFVSRARAKQIAITAGQCLPMQRELLSSDITW